MEGASSRHHSSSSPEASRRSRVLGRQYEVLQRLGQGSFGVAYVVRDTKAADGNEELKVLKEIFIGDKLPDNGLDAVREAKLLSKLSHPNIVKYHGSFVQGEMFCIITEYCDNGDLNMMIKRVAKESKRFEEKLVVTYFVQLLMAIKYMHDRKLLHRDIKASNIFLRNNVIKLGDFGITRLLERTTDMASTFTGTPNYMSPEVVQHQGYNSKSDIWSVGCVLYEMCALTVTFQASNLLALMKQIVYEDTPPLPKGYSSDLSDIFNCMMEKDTTKRASATALLRHRYIVKHVSRLKQQIAEQQSAVETDTSAIAEALSGYSHSRKERRQEVQSRAETTEDGLVGDSSRGAAPRSAKVADGKKAESATSSKTPSSSKAKKKSASKSRALPKQPSQSPKGSPKLPVAAKQACSRTPKKKAEKLPARKMTPKEQLQHRKRLKADEEAGRLKLEVRKQYAEQQKTYNKNRCRNTVKRSPPPWVAENPDVCDTLSLFSVTHPIADNDNGDDDGNDLTPYVAERRACRSPSPPLDLSESPVRSGRAGPADRADGDEERGFVSQLEFDELPVGASPSPRRDASAAAAAAAAVAAVGGAGGGQVGAGLHGTSPSATARREEQRFHFAAAEGCDSIDITFSDLTLDTDADDDGITLTRRSGDRSPMSATLRGAASRNAAGAGAPVVEVVTAAAAVPLRMPAVRKSSSVDDNDLASSRYIPEDPDEADELYTREAEFEFDSEEEDDLAAHGNSARVRGDSASSATSTQDSEATSDDGDEVEEDDNGDDDDGHGTCREERDDLADLYDCMSNALKLRTLEDADGDHGVTAHCQDADPDPEPGALSLGDPQQKIRELKRTCVRVLGEDAFKKVYRFLREARSGDSPASEADVRSGLEKLVPRVRDCFVVDQLIFLEHGTKKQ